MNPDRVDAVKQWFNGFGQSLDVEPVQGFAELWKRHVATLVCFLETGKVRVEQGKCSGHTYERAMGFLTNASIDTAFLEQLSPQSAATGDNFEVVKFLVALMHEIRISHEEVLHQDYGLDMQQFEHLKAIFKHIDDQTHWDTVDSWPAVLFEKEIENRPPSTPRTVARIRKPLFTPSSKRMPPSITKPSPLADVLSSPRVREARIAREKDREIRKHRERADTLECEKEDLEARMGYLKSELEKASKRIDERAFQMTRLEKEGESVRAELEEHRNSLAKSQQSCQEAQKRLAESEESKIISEAIIHRLDFEVNEKSGQVEALIAEKSRQQKTVAELHQYNTDLSQKLRSQSDSVEELRKAITLAEDEIREHQMAVESLRERLRQEETDKESQLGVEMERSNDLAGRLSELQRSKDEDQSKYQKEASMTTALCDERDELRDQLREARAELSEFKKQLKTVQSELITEKANFKQADSERKQLTHTYSDLQISYKELSDESHLLRCALVEAETSLKSREMEVSRLSERVINHEAEVKRLHETNITNIKQWGVHKTSLEEKLYDLETELKKIQTDSEHTIQTLIQEKTNAENQVTSLKKDVESTTSDLESLRENSGRIQDVLSSQLSKKDHALNELKLASREAIAKSQETMTLMETQMAKLEKRLGEEETLENELRKDQAQISEKVRSLDKEKAELSSTIRQMTTRIQGMEWDRMELDKCAEDLRKRLAENEQELVQKREEIFLVSKRCENAQSEIVRICGEFDVKRKEMEQKIIDIKADAEKREGSLKMQFLENKQEASEELRSENMNLRAKLEGLESTNSKMETSLISANEHVRKVKTEMVSKNDEAVIRLRSVMERFELEKKDLSTKIATLEGKCDRLTHEKQQLTRETEKIETSTVIEIRGLHRDHDDLFRELRDLQQMYSNLKTASDQQAESAEKREIRYDLAVESFRAQRNELEERLRDTKRQSDTKCKKLELEISRDHERMAALEEKCDDYARKLDESTANTNSIRGNLQTVSGYLAESRQRNKELEAGYEESRVMAYEKSELKYRNDELEADMERLLKDKSKLIAERDELRNMLEMERRERSQLREDLRKSSEPFTPARDAESIFQSVRESYPLSRQSIDQRSFVARPSAGYPLYDGNDEGDSMVSTTTLGDTYTMQVPEAPTPVVCNDTFSIGQTPTKNPYLQSSIFSSPANGSPDSCHSIDSDRVRELHRRNTLCPPHLRSAYPEVSSKFSERLLSEDDFRNSENFKPPPKSTAKNAPGSAKSFHQFRGRVAKMFLSGNETTMAKKKKKSPPKQNVLTPKN